MKKLNIWKDEGKVSVLLIEKFAENLGITFPKSYIDLISEHDYLSPALNDKTHPITLNATKFNCYDSPLLKTQVCGGDFETVLDRSQWGIDYLIDKGMSKDVKVVIQIEAAKQD